MEAILYFRCKTRCYWNGYMWLEYDPENPEHAERGRTNGGVPATMALEVPHHFVCEDPEVEKIRKEFFAWRIGKGSKAGPGAQMSPEEQDIEVPKKQREMGAAFVELGGEGGELWAQLLSGEDAEVTPARTTDEPIADDYSVLTVAELRQRLKELGVVIPSGLNRAGLADLVRKNVPKE